MLGGNRESTSVHAASRTDEGPLEELEFRRPPHRDEQCRIFLDKLALPSSNLEER